VSGGIIQIVTGDRAIRLDSIQSIGPSHRKTEGHGERKWSFDARTAYLDGPLRDGERQTATLTEGEYERLLRRPVQLLPAEPGTSLIRGWAGGASVEMISTPVVAWALCVDGEMRPMTPNGVNDGYSDDGPDDTGLFVELPGGRIEGIGEHTDPPFYENVAEMRADLAKRQANSVKATAHD
jgi:hypothetical protein